MAFIPLAVALVVSGAAPAPAVAVRVAPSVGVAADGVDSLSLHRRAREAQARFTRVQVRESPRTQVWSGGECDERIGWICLRFQAPRGDPDPWRMDREPPPESPALLEAREELLGELAEIAARIPGDSWVRGQWVRYLGESDRWGEALAAARECVGGAPGWCQALEALALHRLGRHEESRERFDDALQRMGEEEADAWFDPSGIMDLELLREFRRLEGEARREFVERFWRVADPWYGTESNELLLEHLSRNVVARIHEGARSPHGQMWGADIREYIIRFGPEVRYARRHDPSLLGRGSLVSGYLEPHLRVLVPGPDALPTPWENGEGFDVPPATFTTERPVGRGLHRVPPTHRIRDLSPLVSRFPRADSTAVVLSWSYPFPSTGHAYWTGVEADSLAPPWPEEALPELWWRPVDPESGRVGEAIPATLVDRGEHLRADAGDVEAGWFVGIVPSGAGILSLELQEPEAHRGWRARQGIILPASMEGSPTVSDLLLLRPDPEGWEPGVAQPGNQRLEALASRALPSTRIEDRRIELAWQATHFGPPGATVEVRVEVEPGEQGWLRRAGERLRLLSPGASVRMGWTDRVDPPEGAEPGLRLLGLDLGGLDAGSYRIRVTLESADGAGRTRAMEVELH